MFADQIAYIASALENFIVVWLTVNFKSKQKKKKKILLQWASSATDVCPITVKHPFDGKQQYNTLLELLCELTNFVKHR